MDGRGVWTPSPPIPSCTPPRKDQDRSRHAQTVDEDAFRPARQQPFKVGLAHRQRQLAQIVTTVSQDVESAELNFFVVLAGVQRIKVRNAVHAEHYRLAVEHERFWRILRAASTIQGYRFVQS